MKNALKLTVAAASLSLLSTTAVLADGPGPVVVVPPPVTPEVFNWTGVYAGLLLSYNTGSFGNDTNFPGDGEGDLDGMGYGGVLGYNFQSGNVIYGGELTYSGLEVDGAEACVNPTFECGVEVSNMASIRGRVGMAAGERSMVYVTAGWASADVFAYTDDFGVVGRNGESKNLSGLVFGVGFEHAVSDRFSLRGAILHHNFNEGDFLTDVPYTDIGVDFTTIEVGGVLRF
ncbi:MAG: outer membrane beta-barrel protein [Paracoccaceae bacterium]|nr:outer membrane beta-barrel protein [Paracoccaceae bacterium]